MSVSSEIPPHELQLVLDFVNTLDVERQIDRLGTPAGLDGWLQDHGLVAGPARPAGPAERRLAIELREALRAAMHAHSHPDLDPAPAAAVLERFAAAGRLSVRFAADGSIRVEPRDDGHAGTLARLLVPVARSAADGTWLRVKACDAEDCQEAFYDFSRNRSGRWCDMAVCGNRTKVRAYRSKQAR